LTGYTCFDILVYAADPPQGVANAFYKGARFDLSGIVNTVE
jgi:hypothetical protein